MRSRIEQAEMLCSRDLGFTHFSNSAVDLDIIMCDHFDRDCSGTAKYDTIDAGASTSCQVLRRFEVVENWTMAVAARLFLTRP